MTDADIHAALTDIFHEIFMRDDLVLTPSLTAGDVEGWDSFKQIDIIMAVEERWNIKFSTRELDNLMNVGDLLHIIREKSGQ